MQVGTISRFDICVFTIKMIRSLFFLVNVSQKKFKGDFFHGETGRDRMGVVERVECGSVWMCHYCVCFGCFEITSKHIEYHYDADWHC